MNYRRLYFKKLIHKSGLDNIIKCTYTNALGNTLTEYFKKPYTEVEELNLEKNLYRIIRNNYIKDLTNEKYDKENY